MTSTITGSAADSLALRRSTQPDALVAPGPSAAEIDRLVEIALRVPDHGRLTPWRLVLIAGEAKQRWVERLMQIVETREDAGKTRVSTRKLTSAPLVVVVVSKPLPGHKVPEWEQWLSAGAVCMNLLNGAHALGYGANWLTGWHAYDAQATALLGLAEGEKVAGVVLVGSIAEPAPPRPRAAASDVARWLAM
ncbi:nitroreductase family protein [Sphingomonas jatrophae]|uniref:Putative NAD(P)H nitroreductase n=1 Tax=Sphingomonas jatrophae TaxID=1166337 RepID=A0A1I6M4W5_9SPHN|nr:nitroreductase [Sphingomonas jatrophae]SFS10693.1 Nitroreductase [Sphingomonas jatrophae]